MTTTTWCVWHHNKYYVRRMSRYGHAKQCKPSASKCFLSAQMNFAYSSVKWRPRYDWRFVGGDGDASPIMSHASHYRSLGCTRPSFGPLRHTDPSTRARETQQGLFYPTGRSIILNDASMGHIGGARYRKYAALMDSQEWKVRRPCESPCSSFSATTLPTTAISTAIAATILPSPLAELPPQPAA